MVKATTHEATAVTAVTGGGLGGTGVRAQHQGQVTPLQVEMLLVLSVTPDLPNMDSDSDLAPHCSSWAR